MFCYREI